MQHYWRLHRTLYVIAGKDLAADAAKIFFSQNLPRKFKSDAAAAEEVVLRCI